MKLSVFAGLLLSVPSAYSEDIATNEGKVYQDAKVSRTEPDGIVIVTTSGIIKLYFIELPEAIQQK